MESPCSAGVFLFSEQKGHYKLKYEDQQHDGKAVQNKANPCHLVNLDVSAGKNNGVGRGGHGQHKGTAAGDGHRYQQVQHGDVQAVVDRRPVKRYESYIMGDIE